MSLRVPKFQVVDRDDGSRVAQYLVVAKVGGCSFGQWRTFSQFKALAKSLRDLDSQFHDQWGYDHDFANTLVSWEILLRRQKWFRCLDKDYLAVKCFLLERFLHDALYEAPSASVFSNFLEIRAGHPL